MKVNIPIYKPFFSGEEKTLVNDCLDSTWISSKGKYINVFEEEFSKYTGIKKSSTVSNGTVALHLALLALDIKEGDEVIVPTFTYVASVNAIKYVGATPVFIDSESDFWQLSIDDLKKKITSKTKAIMAVHIYGHPCDMKELSIIAKENNLFVIEDCAEALGSYISDEHVGNFSDISTFSFFGNKTITTGEGGMVCSNSEILIDKVNTLKSQGLDKIREYWHSVLGYNYRMTNISAAIGVAQLKIADKILGKKREIYFQYRKHLKKEILLQQEKSGYTHSYWMVSVLFENEESRTKVRSALKENGIETRPLFPLVNEMPIYKDDQQESNNQFNIKEISQRGINLPSFPSLTEKEIIFISGIINSEV